MECSNTEIAARLFLSPKTVERHVSNAMRKLHVSSRQDLAPALAGKGEDLTTA